MRLAPSQPDLVTLLAMRPVPQAGVVVTLEVEGSARTEPIAERVFSNVARSWTPGSTQGFSTGSGAFVMTPSQNERASESFLMPGIKLSIQTEAVEEPEDGESSMAPPPGARQLVKRHHVVGGFNGVERRVQPPGESLTYVWIFPGKPADGTAPRIRLAATAPLDRAAALDETGNALLSTWHLRPVGVP